MFDRLRFQSLISDTQQILQPPEDLNVTEWTEKYRRLSPESSASPGRIKISNAEYQREMLNVCGEPDTREVTFMTSSQVGKTTIIENIHGYFMHQAPCPMLNVQFSGTMLEEFSKNRISTMCRDSPVLAKIFKSKISSQSTIHRRMYPGGSLSYATAQSPGTLASRPVKVVTFDETDRYEKTKEGDAIEIGSKRVMAFWDSLIIKASTPGLEVSSVIERSFKLSDMRYFHIKCPHCTHEQKLKWSNVKWQDDDAATAKYLCADCGTLLDDIERHDSISKGRWIAEKPFVGHAGFHLSELYSPWRSLQQIVESFLRCKDHSDLLQVWVNTTLGETWKEEGESVDPTSLIARADEYEIEDYKLPSDKIVDITMGTDVQKGYLQYELVGWGEDSESWSLEVGELYGDTSELEVYMELEDVRNQLWTHPSGQKMSVRMSFIDSGYNTSTVYEYVKSCKSKAIKAIKGMSGKRPILEEVNKKLKRREYKNKLKPEILGVDTAKVKLHNQLNTPKPGRSYCHFGTHNEEEFFLQITAEELRTKFVKGFAVLEWFNTRARNEATDTRVYAYAAYLKDRVDFQKEYDKLHNKSHQSGDASKVKARRKVRMGRKR